MSKPMLHPVSQISFIRVAFKEGEQGE